MGRTKQLLLMDRIILAWETPQATEIRRLVLQNLTVRDIRAFL